MEQLFLTKEKLSRYLIQPYSDTLKVLVINIIDMKVCIICKKEYKEDEGHCHIITGECHCNDCHDVSTSKKDGVCEFC